MPWIVVRNFRGGTQTFPIPYSAEKGGLPLPYGVIEAVPFPGGVDYRECVLLTRKFWEYYPWKWCISGILRTILDFHVERLNAELVLM